ncbi:hypothetical protein [Rhizobium sp. FKY42]|uniref:hypothetical protein n=1 Tax=Rhizobium sp. FKY42 TaxID=2562310 RepID=UPI0010C10E26|nr:hypothetical protein [Rhizobium sp. FKY42]
MTDGQSIHGFREWVDEEPNPSWKFLPLTHITKCITGEAVIKSGNIRASWCSVFETTRAYFFYGRPSYRVHGDGPIKVAAACPMCFILDGILLSNASDIYAFDTGAHASRMYDHALLKEIPKEEFNLMSAERVNRLIAKVFGSLDRYFLGETDKIRKEGLVENWQFASSAFLDLITSRGRNEPDDRISAIEVSFDSDVEFVPHLKAIVVPDSIYGLGSKAPWLEELADAGCEVAPYKFRPGRNADYYYALIEAEVTDMYRRWRLI